MSDSIDLEIEFFNKLRAMIHENQYMLGLYDGGYSGFIDDACNGCIDGIVKAQLRKQKENRLIKIEKDIKDIQTYLKGKTNA